MNVILIRMDTMAHMMKRMLVPAVGLAFWWPFLRNSVTGFVFATDFAGPAEDRLAFCAFMASAVLMSTAGAVALWKTSRPLARLYCSKDVLPIIVLVACMATSVANLTVVCTSGAPHAVALCVCIALMAVSYVTLPVAWGMLLLRIVPSVRACLP